MTRPPQIPAPLLRSTPRPVALTGAGKAVAVTALLIVAGAIAAGIGLYLLASRDRERERSMRTEAASAQAEVIRTGRTHGDHPHRFADYVYRTGGVSYRGRVVPHGTERFEAGDQITVRYLLSDPRFSWLPGHKPSSLPFWLVPLVPAVLLLVALAIGARIRAERTLLETGRPAIAVVTKTKPFQANNRRAYRVSYDFRILSGATRSGRYDISRPPETGAHLIVVYDPDRPNRNARYPFTLVRAL